MTNVSLQRKYFRSAGLFLSSLYLFLLGAASFCMFAHAGAPQSQKHHAEHTTNHSTLCIWACQVGSYSSTGQITLTPETKPDLLIALRSPDSSTFIPQDYSHSARSRAPPASSLSL